MGLQGLASQLEEDDAKTTTVAMSPSVALAFIFAGNAHVTFRNRSTGNRFTFRIRAPRKQRNEARPVHFVHVLQGPDNNSDYGYIGCIFDQSEFRWTREARISTSAQSFRTFAWVFARLLDGTLPPDIEIYHEGRCGRCGRRLTVPESVESGIGPECAGRM